MNILLPENVPYSLDNYKENLSQLKMCVFDYSDKNDMDFIWKTTSTFMEYKYPSVELLIGNYYTVELPLNFRILTTNTHDYNCTMVSLEDLIHFDNKVPLFNPIYIGIPKIWDIEIRKVNPLPISHFVAKLPKKNLLMIPVGKREQWKTYISENDYGDNKKYFPDCIFVSDDIDGVSKSELNLYDDIIQ